MDNMFGKSLKYILTISLIISLFKTYAQRDTSLTREVEVVKSYSPTITDANKISGMPNIEDAEHEKPAFNYSIFSQPIFSTFSVNPLKAASFSSAPPEDTGYGLIKAGVGNYNRPYGELFFNSQNIRNTIFGLHGRHLSSHGKLKLDGGDKVNAPFSENEADMFVKHFFNNSLLSVNLNLNHDGFNYYGYPVDTVPGVLKEEDQQINYFDTRQTFTKGSFNINLQNIASGSRDLVFDFDFLYHYLGTKTGQKEHYGEFIADITKPYDRGVGYLNAGVAFINADEILSRSSLSVGRSRQIWLKANPSYKLGGEIASIQAGLKGWFVLDDNTDATAKIAPQIIVRFAPVKEIIKIFAGLDGQLISNHYSKIAYENPFVDPLHDVKITNEKYRFYGGFDGKFARSTNFRISADYSVIKSQPLYYLFKYSYTDPETMNLFKITDNDFKFFYDDLDLLKFNVEFFHYSIKRLNLLLGGNYYVYKMENQEAAWNLPDWDAKFSLEYKISEQLNVSTDLFLTGARKALILEITGEDPGPVTHEDLMAVPGLQQLSYNMPTVFDLNFQANYKITGQFALFARLNNFAFQKYQKWLGYPVQSFNFLGGLSYAF